MIIKYSDNNENRIEWQHRRGGEWKTAELDELIEAYERETEPGDLISREQAIQLLKKIPDSNWKTVKYVNVIKSLPPARYKRKWKRERPDDPMCDLYYCSECGSMCTNVDWNFCPMCGSEMEIEE